MTVIWHSLFHHVIINKFWHDGNSNGPWALRKYITNIFVLSNKNDNHLQYKTISLSYFKSNDILAVNFGQIVINKNTITSGRWIFSNGLNLSVPEGKPNVVGAVFLHCYGALKWPKIINSQRITSRKWWKRLILPVTDGKSDLVSWSFLNELAHLVLAPTGHSFTIDLEDLVTKPQACHSSWWTGLDKADKDSFAFGMEWHTTFSLPIFAECDFTYPWELKRPLKPFIACCVSVPCLIWALIIPTLPTPLTGPEAVVDTAVVAATTACCGWGG